VRWATCATWAATTSSSPTTELLASGFAALEGPTLDDDDALLFSDLRAGGVYRLRSGGGVNIVVRDRKGIGGICLHASGGLVLSGPDLCHVRGHERRVLLELGDLETRLGCTAHAFNDIAADPDGRVLAGVLREDDDGSPVRGELVLVTAAREHVVVHDDLHPNGIGLSPDASRLFVADTFRRRLIVFDVGREQLPAPVGEISTAAIAGVPDGLAVDAEGCIWVAFYRGGCVVRFTPDGRIERRVPVPALKPLSVCLAGEPDPALYVVTATREPGSDETGSVYRLSVEVSAAPRHQVLI
jgi:D-xylonolactonase